MKTLIVANWKMNPQNLEGAKLLFDSVANGIKNLKNVEIVICPPFLYILNLKSQILNLKLGGQDCFWEEKGAFTGEISPEMLKDLGCDYVIIGHSERRKYQKETDEIINKKIIAAMSAKLRPILCIGENENERKSGKTSGVLKNQIKKDLNRLTAQSLDRLIIAYEPVWAIGTGKACDTGKAKKVNSLLRESLGEKISILYGGSVNSQNAKDYIQKVGFSGLLVGGASLNPREFLKIIQSID